MLNIRKATDDVKKNWVHLYGDEGFYSDEVFDAISSAHKKDPTEATYNALREHLTDNGYNSALSIINEVCAKRKRCRGRFAGVVPVRYN